MFFCAQKKRTVKLQRPVELVNMGGVKKPLDIPIFLFNMFNDENIIPIKQPFRALLSAFITLLRSKGTYSIYKRAKSPVFEISAKQVKKLSEYLKTDIKASFTYSKPFTQKGAYTYVPLFNFYSHTTHGKILRQFNNVFPPFCIFGEFFDLFEHRIKESLSSIPNQYKNKTAVVLSAHSLPVELAKKTKDPYEHDINVFLKYLKKRIETPIFLSFQSKLGPVNWLKPSTEETIKKLSKKYKALIITPVSFVSDNTETIYEIDITYKKLAYQCSFEYFKRVDCFNDSDDFMLFLAKYIKKRCK